jgi:hypothetical protein
MMNYHNNKEKYLCKLYLTTLNLCDSKSVGHIMANETYKLGQNSFLVIPNESDWKVGGKTYFTDGDGNG